MSLLADSSPGKLRILHNAPASLLRSADTVTSPAAASLRSGATPEPVSLGEACAAARAEGYTEGEAAGYAKAATTLEADRVQLLEALVKELVAAAAVAATTREAVLAEVTGDAVELAYELTRTIVGDEAVTQALPPQSAVARALELAPEGEDLVVRVPPTSPLTASDLVGLCDTARIMILEDAAVEAGGCVVEAGACRIDNQISSALERVRKVLDDARPVEPRPADARPAAGSDPGDAPLVASDDHRQAASA